MVRRSRIISVLLHVLAQADLDLVTSSGVLLVDGLLLLVRQQDVRALVAGAAFQSGLGLLLIGLSVLDVLAGQRSGVLRLSQLLPVLRHCQLRFLCLMKPCHLI